MPEVVYLHFLVVCKFSWLHSFCLWLLENTFKRQTVMVVPWILCCFNDILISSVHVHFVNLAIIDEILLCWETGDWFSFGRCTLSIFESISSGNLWRITLCISFATILVVVPQDSLSGSCLMFWKMRVFLRLPFLMLSRSSWRIFKWFSRPTILAFNESMSLRCYSFQCSRKSEMS